MGHYYVPVRRVGDSWHYEKVELIERAQKAWDCLNPLPHPGYRVGQIWTEVSNRGSGVISIVATRTHNGYTEHLLSDRIEWEKELNIREHMDAFLVADPACPWLAPWAPVAAVVP